MNIPAEDVHLERKSALFANEDLQTAASGLTNYSPEPSR